MHTQTKRSRRFRSCKSIMATKHMRMIRENRFHSIHASWETAFIVVTVV